MKIFIAFMLLFFTNCFAPVAISATVNVKMGVVHSVVSPAKTLIFKTIEKQLRPKWVRILEWAIPFFLLLAILLFFSSLSPSNLGFSYWGGGSVIAKSDNFILCMIAFSMGVATAITLFVLRIVTHIKSRKRI